MNIKLKKMHIENFKKIKEKDIDFGNLTRISGQNAVGKTTIADASMWCLFDKNSQGEAKFQIRPLDSFGNQIDHVEIRVILTLEVDGCEVVLQKVQKQNWVKKRGSLTETLQGNVNTFEIDGIPKKEKDYKKYIAGIVDEELFKLITNPQAFVSKKWQEQRKELMKFAPDIDNEDVIASNPKVLQELALALSLHSPEDLQIKAKKALSEYKKQQTEIPARIDEVRKSMTDIDVAELELQRNGLKEQIVEIEKSEEDMTTQYKRYQEETDGLLELKMQLTDMERRANKENDAARRKHEDALADFDNDIASSERKIETLQQNIAGAEGTISAYEKKREELLVDWKEENAKQYTDALEFDENSTICSMCGQSYPKDKIQQIKEDFEQKKADIKAKWEKDHRETLDRIVADGNRYKGLIEQMQAKLDDAKSKLSAEQMDLQSAEVERKKVADLLEAMPDKIDVSGNEEYKKLASQISEKEKLLNSTNSGAEMRQQLRIKKNGLKEELFEVEKQITSADNSAKEERIEELQQKMSDIANKVNEQEKMIYLLEEFTKAKMTMISKIVNEKFGVVDWKLFDKQVNGAVIECCECTMNGVPFSALNTGHRIVAGLDIINTLSELYGVTAPIFVDNAEAVNEFNLPELDTQMVLLSVSDDKEMKIESEG
ncbi:MAG: AAA family ATPase [Lachnospiraceae bacterium]|nr:AAA family ATPase [Lachnospiraceae bacterium]